MSFVTDLIDHATGASAMNEATDLQREMFNYNQQLSKEDRAAGLEIYDNANKEGFFNWRHKLDLYDKAVDPTNARDLRNVGVALRSAGARPGDTNVDAATAMVLNAQKQQRGDTALKYYDQGFKDRMIMRQAINGNTAALAAQQGQNLSNTLMQQGQQQAQQFGMFSQYISPFLFGNHNKTPGAGGGVVKNSFSGLGTSGGYGQGQFGGGSGGPGGFGGSQFGGAKPDVASDGTMQAPGSQGAYRPGFFADTQRWLA